MPLTPEQFTDSLHRLNHEMVNTLTRFRVILLEIVEDSVDTSRERAILDDVNAVLKEAEKFPPTMEQLKRWEQLKHDAVWKTQLV